MHKCNYLPSETDARVLLRSSLSFRFFRIVKEQPIRQHIAKHARGALCVALRVLVEPTGIEPVTSCLQSRRSPS